MQRKYGRDAIGVFGGGSLTNEKAYLLGKFARVALGTSEHRLQRPLLHVVGRGRAAMRAFGLDRGLPFPVADIAQADAILLVGGNVAETMPPIMQYFEAQRRAGGAADRRRSAPHARPRETATLHLPLMPGTDAVLANGLLHVLIRERLIDETTSASAPRASRQSARTPRRYWPERVERITGVPQRDIVAAARAARPGSATRWCSRRAAPSSRRRASANVLAFINLALALGRVGRPFSGFGCLTGQGNGQGGREHGQKADQLPGYRQHRRPRGARAHGARSGASSRRDLPGPGSSAYELLDALGRDGGVRALLVIGSNPVVSAPHAAHIEERLRALDLLVVCDFFLSETARARRRRAAVRAVGRGGRHDDQPRGPRAPAAPRRARRREGVRTDLEIISGLAERLGRRRAASRRSAARRVRRAAARHRGRAGRLLGHHLRRVSTRAGRVLAVPVRRTHPGTPRLFAERFPTPTAARASTRAARSAGRGARRASTRSTSPPAACSRSTSRARRRGASRGCAAVAGAARRDPPARRASAPASPTARE